MNTLIGDQLLDLMDNPTNATFCGSGGMGDDMTIMSGTRHAGKFVSDGTA